MRHRLTYSRQSAVRTHWRAVPSAFHWAVIRRKRKSTSPSRPCSNFCKIRRRLRIDPALTTQSRLSEALMTHECFAKSYLTRHERLNSEMSGRRPAKRAIAARRARSADMRRNKECLLRRRAGAGCSSFFALTLADGSKMLGVFSPTRLIRLNQHLITRLRHALLQHSRIALALQPFDNDRRQHHDRAVDQDQEYILVAQAIHHEVRLAEKEQRRRDTDNQQNQRLRIAEQIAHHDAVKREEQHRHRLVDKRAQHVAQRKRNQKTEGTHQRRIEVDGFPALGISQLDDAHEKILVHDGHDAEADRRSFNGELCKRYLREISLLCMSMLRLMNCAASLVTISRSLSTVMM